MAAIQFNNVIKRYGSGPKANQVIHGVTPSRRRRVRRHRRPLGLRQVHPAAHGGGLEEITGGEISIGERVVNDLEPPSATSPWCSRTTRCTRT
jgi:sn-glycerol 3-phosphate transport system ATP-binding protein